MHLSNTILLALYLAFGIFAVFIYPINLFELSKQTRQLNLESTHNSLLKSSRKSLVFAGFISLIGIGACILLPWTYAIPMVLVTFIGARFQQSDKLQTGSAILLGLIAASYLPWWMHNDKNRLALTLLQSLAMLSVTAFAYWAFSWGTRNPASVRQLPKICLWILFATLSILIVFAPGVGLASTNFFQWHHWSAYIGPAQLILNGAIPFNDIPMQYGFGPTMTIMAGCTSNCWTSLYWASGITTVCYCWGIAYAAVKISRPRNLAHLSIVLVIVLLSTLFYTAFPPNLLTAIGTPSTNGLRFLPGVLMLCLLIRQISSSDQVNAPDKANSNIYQIKYMPMHAVWLASFLWAPEAAIQTSILWLPYCTWSTLNTKNDSKKILLSLVKIGIRFLVLFIVALLVFYISFRLKFNVWPKLNSYFVYILYPPGPMPVNSNGSVWFAVVSAILWLITAKRIKANTQDIVSTKVLWVVALLCFANFTYYLGRSHDNNILNLMPYFSLLLMGVNHLSEKGMIKIISSIMLCSIIGCFSLFGFNHYKLAIENKRLLDKFPTELVASFNRELDATDQYLKPKTDIEMRKLNDARRAIQHLHNFHNEAIETFDQYLVIDAGESTAPWNALHGPANFPFVPAHLRRQYLKNIAARFSTSGWVLYDKDYDINSYLQDYDTVYIRDQELDFGTYYAIHYIPNLEITGKQ